MNEMPDEIRGKRLTEFPGKGQYQNAFIRAGLVTVGAVIDAIETHGMYLDGDYWVLKNPYIRNAGRKTWGWLFSVLDVVGYDWQGQGMARVDMVEAANQAALALDRLALAYNNLPEEIRQRIANPAPCPAQSIF